MLSNCLLPTTSSNSPSSFLGIASLFRSLQAQLAAPAD
jgi:hypothetical protein